jgi:hypothetical protein
MVVQSVATATAGMGSFVVVKDSIRSPTHLGCSRHARREHGRPPRRARTEPELTCRTSTVPLSPTRGIGLGCAPSKPAEEIILGADRFGSKLPVR